MSNFSDKISPAFPSDDDVIRSKVLTPRKPNSKFIDKTDSTPQAPNSVVRWKRHKGQEV